MMKRYAERLISRAYDGYRPSRIPDPSVTTYALPVRTDFKVFHAAAGPFDNHLLDDLMVAGAERDR